MNRSIRCFALVAFALLGFALNCPAPLIFTPGEGWRYEKAGGAADARGVVCQRAEQFLRVAIEKGF